MLVVWMKQRSSKRSRYHKRNWTSCQRRSGSCLRALCVDALTANRETMMQIATAEKRRASRKRYDASPKGKARRERYEGTVKAQARKKAYEAKHPERKERWSVGMKAYGARSKGA